MRTFSTRGKSIGFRGNHYAAEIGHAAFRYLVATSNGPDTNAIIEGSIGVKRVQEVLGIHISVINCRLDRGCNGPTNVQIAEMHKLDLRHVYQGRLVERVNLGTVELRPQNREFVGTHIEVKLVEAEERLITKTRATRIMNVGGIDLIDHGLFEWIVIRTYFDIEMGMLVIRVDSKNSAKPGLRCGIKIAARVTGELAWWLTKEADHSDKPGSERAVAVIEREHRVHFLQYKITIDAKALIRGFDSTPIHVEAINSAQSIEVLQQ